MATDICHSGANLDPLVDVCLYIDSVVPKLTGNVWDNSIFYAQIQAHS